MRLACVWVLVLATALTAAAPSARFTPEQITLLRQRNALMPCETGLGREAAGEGLLGLQRAFASAGAPSVVSSLWKVDDRATQELMGHFYRLYWDRKTVVSRVEALRQAQLAMLREGVKRGMVRRAVKVVGSRLPPYYWAAFVLSGDWR